MKRLAIDEQRLRELWATDASVPAIAAELGGTPSFVSHRALQLGLPRRAVSTAALPQSEIVRVYVDHGLSMAQIVERLRPRFPTLAETTIKRILLARGVTLRPRAEPAVDHIAECVRLSRAGLEGSAIARRLGLTRDQVMRRLHRAGVFVGRGRRPQLPVAAILSRAAAGESYVAIAAALGCTPSAVGIHVRAARRRKADASAQNHAAQSGTTTKAAPCNAAGVPA